MSTRKEAFYIGEKSLKRWPHYYCVNTLKTQNTPVTDETSIGGEQHRIQSFPVLSNLQIFLITSHQ